MKYVVSKGRNVDEAINLGLKLMDSSKDKVNIEVIEHGKERFLKALSKEAVVKLTMNENYKKNSTITDLLSEFLIDNESEESRSRELVNSQEIIRDELQGNVWVKDGKIFCEITEDNYPTVKIPEELTVLINGKVFKGKSLILSEEESYELKSEVVEKEMKWEITMDRDKLNVFLHVEPGYIIDYTVLDAEPNQHIELSVVKNKRTQNTLDFKDVIEKMGLLGIKHGFNHSEIMMAMRSN